MFSAPGRFSPSHQDWPLRYSDFYPQRWLLPFSWTTIIITKPRYLHSACGLWDIPAVKCSSSSPISSLCCIPLYALTSIDLPIHLSIAIRTTFILTIGYFREHICEYCAHVFAGHQHSLLLEIHFVKGLCLCREWWQERGRPVPQATTPGNSLSPVALRKQAPSEHSQSLTHQNGD